MNQKPVGALYTAQQLTFYTAVEYNVRKKNPLITDEKGKN